jgi:hypothetical protein
MELVNTAWVTDDGSYGVGAIITLSPDSLSDEQWERVSEMSDNSRYEYVRFILEDDDFFVRQIEKENFGEEWGL